MGENGKVVTLEISSQLLELYASIKRRTFAFRTMHNSEIVFHHTNDPFSAYYYVLTTTYLKFDSVLLIIRGE